MSRSRGDMLAGSHGVDKDTVIEDLLLVAERETFPRWRS